MSSFPPSSSPSFMLKSFRKQSCHILTVTRREADLFTSMSWGRQRLTASSEAWSSYGRDYVSVPVAAGAGTDDQKRPSCPAFLVLWNIFKHRAFSTLFFFFLFSFLIVSFSTEKYRADKTSCFVRQFIDANFKAKWNRRLKWESQNVVF